MNNAPRYRRKDRHPVNAGLLFWRYNRGKEIWVSTSEYERQKKESISRDRAWKTTKLGRKCAKDAWTRANAKRKQKYSEYWKQPHVRQRLRDKHNSNPKVIAGREARLNRRTERATYLHSEEYKAILKVKNHEKWLKRKAAGKTREYDRNRWKTNLQYRLGSNMRRLIHQVITRLSGTHKHAKTFQLIGCSISALRVHLEAQFVEGMSWENYGSAWHVDHLIPISLFDLNDDLQQRQAFYFENLRPLWKSENHSKSDKVEIEGKEVRARDVRTIIPFKAA